MKINLGKYHTWMTRMMSYGSLINFTMLLYLYITQSPLGIPWYVWFTFLVSLLPIIVFIDTVFIYPQSLKYSSDRNPEWKAIRETRDIVEELHKELSEMALDKRK
jgi:hypothetical protein